MLESSCCGILRVPQVWFPPCNPEKPKENCPQPPPLANIWLFLPHLTALSLIHLNRYLLGLLWGETMVLLLLLAGRWQQVCKTEMCLQRRNGPQVRSVLLPKLHIYIWNAQRNWVEYKNEDISHLLIIIIYTAFNDLQSTFTYIIKLIHHKSPNAIIPLL